MNPPEVDAEFSRIAHQLFAEAAFDRYFAIQRLRLLMAQAAAVILAGVLVWVLVRD